MHQLGTKNKLLHNTMRLVLLIIITGIFNGSLAQSPPLRSFSVKEGLPSGIVYDCLEDRNGFMWFATEAGLARFDGINFQTYTTEDGLSNNSILQIIEDNDGSIWIFPFGTSPCIFDWTQQRIITAKENAILAELGKYAEHLSVVKKGHAILIFADSKFYVIENRILTKLWDDQKFDPKPFFYSGDSLYLLAMRSSRERLPILLCKYYRGKNGWQQRSADTISFPDETFYFASSLTKTEDFGVTKILPLPYGFSAFDVSRWDMPQLKLKAKIRTKGLLNSIRRTGNYIYICTTSGILVYDMNIRLVEELWPEHSFSNFFQDRKGNKWYCKLDGSGVFMTLGNGVKAISRADGLSAENISAILVTKPGTLLTGGADGNIQQLVWKEGNVHAKNLGHLNSWLRQLLKTGTTHLGLSDKEIAIIKGENAIIRAKVDYAFKAAVTDEKDSVLIGHSAGIVKSGFGLENMYTHIAHLTRVSAISYFADTVFLGNNKGLFFIPDYHNRISGDITIKETAIKDPVTAMSFAADSILWVGTNTQGLIVYRHNKINTRVPYSASLPGGNYLIKRIYPEPHKKRVWVATNKGLQLINYYFRGDEVETSSRFITSRDGLADDDVNDVSVSGDTIFAATIKGISFFSDTLKAITVPIRITGITLNDKDSTLPAAALYNIRYSRSSFSVHYSGICFTCDGKIMYRYRLTGPGRDTSWISTPVNTVEFGGLEPGQYVFQVTTDSSAITETVIVITPAFWQKGWFYGLLILAAALVTTIIVRWYISRLKRNNEKRIEQNKKLSELELRALQSQMNPHFIFNSMNSLQKFILTNDISNANEYLAGFSKLLRLFLDASRNRFIPVSKEVELLRLYIELEQMRQMTKFNYEVKMAGNISPELQIPSVIIQPFVENAIVHGLRYLEDKPGKLDVEMTMQGSLFICVITDNGVGRKKAREIQSQKTQQYKSYGTSIIEEKIETLRKIENTDITVEINDRDEEAGGGTVVTIKFKTKEDI